MTWPLFTAVLLILLSVNVMDCGVQACPASIWSPQLPSRLLETSPAKQCGEIRDETECKTLNLCCFQNNECIPSNTAYAECPAAKTLAECDELGASYCWFDGAYCRRTCPYTGNVEMLCAVLGTLAKQRTPSPTRQPTVPATLGPTLLPTKLPTPQPTQLPTKPPTPLPSKPPTSRPTNFPTKPPTTKPTKFPTLEPTVKPTKLPTKTPTSRPSTAMATTTTTLAPTRTVTWSPTVPLILITKAPTLLPTTVEEEEPYTRLPTRRPTFSRPTTSPTLHPTSPPATEESPSTTPTPTAATQAPSYKPTVATTLAPVFIIATPFPTFKPSRAATAAPVSTDKPTTTTLAPVPTHFPTFKPSKAATAAPMSTPKPTTATLAPVPTPTHFPTFKPSKAATAEPVPAPTHFPTFKPSSSTTSPTTRPTTTPPVFIASPTFRQTAQPTPPKATKAPTKTPTRKPTAAPTTKVTKAPVPTVRPTPKTTKTPTIKPTNRPTAAPVPTVRPTLKATKAPTGKPTAAPVPTALPTPKATKAPTNKPTVKPTVKPTPPTLVPTKKPTQAPTPKTTKRPTPKPTRKPVRPPTKKPTKAQAKNPFPRWSPALVQERNPTTACRALANEAACAQHNFCCWRQDDQTCFPPTDVAGIECPLIEDATVCGVVWREHCQWTGNTGCRRILPTAMTTSSPRQTADQICTRLAVGHTLSRETRYKSFDSLATPTVNETAQQETKQSAVNPHNQYCWNKPTKSECTFPFTYLGKTYNDCLTGGNKRQCMTASSTNKLVDCTCTARQRERSVLLITLDDLRPEMNLAYGRRAAVTPVLDKFAKRPGTVVMDRAYTQFSWCSPSRDSFLTSLLPDTTRSYSFAGNGVRDHAQRSKFKTLPQLFKDAGYYTAGGGKIFHLNRDDPKSWNEYYSGNQNQNSACTDDAKATRFRLLDGSTTTLGCITTQYSNILDVPVLNGAMSTLERIVQAEKEPFFMAVGLYKPHMPYHVHTTFWNRFATSSPPEYEKMDEMGAPGPRSAYADTVNLTYDFTASAYGKLWGNTNPLEDKSTSRDKMHFRQLMRRGYLASVYQVDDMLGQLLNKLDDLALRQSTLVVIVGDHGFHLGENNAFAKQTNFEIAVRVPLLIHVPWFRALGSASSSEDQQRAGGATAPYAQGEDALPESTPVRRNGDFFELVDLMPTIASLMHVPQPKYTEGSDQSGQVALAALGPSSTTTTTELPTSKPAAFSQMVRCTMVDCTFAEASDVNVMGYSVRTHRWRYTAWMPAPGAQVQWTSSAATLPLAQELYDHSKDDESMLAYDDVDNGARFGEMEMTNVADHFPDVCAKLLQMITDRYNKRNILLA